MRKSSARPPSAGRRAEGAGAAAASFDSPAALLVGERLGVQGFRFRHAGQHIDLGVSLSTRFSQDTDPGARHRGQTFNEFEVILSVAASGLALAVWVHSDRLANGLHLLPDPR